MAVRPTDQRVVGEPRRPVATEQPRQADLPRRRVEEVAPADDQVDPVAEVVDDDREPVGPVAVPVAHDEVAAGGHLARRGGPRRTSSQDSVPAPSATRTVVSGAPRLRHSPGQPGPCQARPWIRAHAVKVERVQSQPYASPCDAQVARGPPRTPPSRRGRSAGPVRRRARTRATRGPRGAPRRRPAGCAGGRGPRSGAVRGRRTPRPGPTPRSRSRRARDGGTPSAPGRTASRVRACALARARVRGQPASSCSSPTGRCPSRASSARTAPISRRYNASRSAWASGPVLAMDTRSRTSRSRSASRTARQPDARFSRPTSRASSARSLSSVTRRAVERVDPAAQAAQLGGLGRSLRHGRPPYRRAIDSRAR